MKERPLNFASYLEECLARKPLTVETHQKFFCEIFNQTLDASQIAALLVAWRAMGETAELLEAGAWMDPCNEEARMIAFIPVPLLIFSAWVKELA